MDISFIIESSHIKLIKEFVKFFKTTRKLLYSAGLLMLISLLLALPMPYISMKIVDQALMTKNYELFILLIIAWLVILSIRLVADYFQAKYSFKFQIESTQYIRAKVFNHLFCVHLDYYRDKQTGYLISRVSQDVEEATSVLGSSILDFTRNVLSLIFGIFFVVYINWSLAIIAFAIVPFYMISQRLYNKKIREISRLKKDEWSKIGGFLQEIFIGLFNVKAYSKEDFETDRFISKSSKAITLSEISFKLTQYARLINNLIQGISPVIILSIAGYMILKNQMTVGELVGFLGYLSMLYGPATKVFGYAINLQSALVSVERIFEILNEKKESYAFPEIVKVGIENIHGAVKFDNVSFSYQNNGQEFKIANLNLSISKGEVIALAGRSGSGKTTITNLMLGYYSPINGKILIDDYDIKEIGLQKIRSIIGVVTQEPFIFSGTILENILYGRPDATEKEVIQAAVASYADNFISELPAAYNTSIGERGFQLSGGQKQMISLARTILKNPKILILDEATSSIDFQSEILIKKAILRIMQGRTTIIVSHRISSFKNVGKIVFIENGSIKAIGPHNILYNQNEKYTTFYESGLI